VQYIKLAIQCVGLGSEWVRAPRLTLTGEERKRILGIIEAGIAARPQLPPKPRKPATSAKPVTSTKPVKR
jgi:hypothetical protein